MGVGLKQKCAILVLFSAGLGLSSDPASAVTAEVARKCSALTTKQFPPREPGNPAHADQATPSRRRLSALDMK